MMRTRRQTMTNQAKPTREEVQSILRKQAEQQKEAAQRPFYTIAGYDNMMGEVYSEKKAYATREAAQAACRSNEWTEEWTFSHEVFWMDNSTDRIFKNTKTGEERKRPGMFAHGDLC